MIYIIAILVLLQLLLIYFLVAQQRQLRNFEDELSNRPTTFRMAELRNEFTSFQKAASVVWQQSKFNRDRVDDVLKAMDQMETNFMQFSGFISTIINQLTGTRVKRGEYAVAMDVGATEPEKTAVIQKKSMTKEEQINQMTRAFFKRGSQKGNI